MVAVAALYDLLQGVVSLLHGIPFVGNASAFIVNSLITVWAWLTFYVWFKLHGVSFMNPKRMAIINIGGFADLILGALPAWTAAVLLLIANTRAEELLEKAGPAGALVAKTISGDKNQLPQKPQNTAPKKQ